MKRWYMFYTKDGISIITAETGKLEQAVQEMQTPKREEDNFLRQLGAEVSGGIPFPQYLH